MIFKQDRKLQIREQVLRGEDSILLTLAFQMRIFVRL